MYGNLVIAVIEQNQNQQALSTLENEIVPQVSQLSGFLSGFWSGVQQNSQQGIAFTTWDSQQSALNAAAQYQPGTSPTEGVLIVSNQTFEIVQNEGGITY